MVYMMQSLGMIVVDEIQDGQGIIHFTMQIFYNTFPVVSVKTDTIFSFFGKFLTSKQMFFIIVNW